MNHENKMLDTLLQLMALDIPDEHVGNALNDRAKMLSPEELLEDPSEIH